MIACGTPHKCELEPIFDTDEVNADSVVAIVENVDDAYIADAIAAAAKKTFRGRSCNTCGAWSPASA